MQLDPENRAEFILDMDKIEKPVKMDDPSTYPKESFAGGEVKDTNTISEFYKNIIK